MKQLLLMNRKLVDLFKRHFNSMATRNTLSAKYYVVDHLLKPNFTFTWQKHDVSLNSLLISAPRQTATNCVNRYFNTAIDQSIDLAPRGCFFLALQFSARQVVGSKRRSDHARTAQPLSFARVFRARREATELTVDSFLAKQTSSAIPFRSVRRRRWLRQLMTTKPTTLKW